MASFGNYVLVYAFAILLLCFVSSPAQEEEDKICNLRIDVYEFKADGTSEQFPVRDAKVRLVNRKTKKSLKISKKTDIPTFADAGETEYEATVSKNGFQTTVDRFTLDCSLANAENTVSEIVFLWEGSSKETYNVPTITTGTSKYVTAKDENSINSGAVLLGKPEYPKAARAARATGKVEVQVTINELGYVISAKAISGHPLLRAASVEAAKKSKFRMTILDGNPVKVTGIIVYNFVP